MMLETRVEPWESMLAIIRLGAVVIPTTTLLQREELEDRLVRGGVRVIIAGACRDSRFSRRPFARLERL